MSSKNFWGIMGSYLGYMNKRVVYKGFSIFLVIVLFSGSVLSEVILSPINEKALNLSEHPQNYSFFIVGHAYGVWGSSVLPAQTLCSNLDIFNQGNASFIILTGNNYRSCTELHVRNFKAFASEIDLPIFNAVGNHDVSNRGMYRTFFGDTVYSFRQGSELFILLDSELDPGGITGDQLSYLDNVLEQEASDPRIKHVFVVMHKLLWCVGEDDLAVVCQHTNVVYPENNFRSVVMPKLIELSQRKQVVLVSGDIGTAWSLPLFYHGLAGSDIILVACGLGETSGDAIIRVDVSEQGGLFFEPVSLTGESLENMGYYGLDYWGSYFSGMPCYCNHGLLWVAVIVVFMFLAGCVFFRRCV